ncbi:MAG: hypothetical protein Q9211_001337 [Gyalolechia sp. 1 TL-2023]
MFEPSLSMSAMRSPTDAPSMADSLPNINFGFDDLRDRMARFTDRFDKFIDKGRKRVLEERNHFHTNVAQLQEDQRLRKREIESLAQKASSHAQAVDREADETAEMHAAIASIAQQRDVRARHRDRIRSEIATVRKHIAQRVTAQQQHARDLDAQAQSNVPELEFWQSYLCMRIEGVGIADRLKFIFSHLDEKNWGREAWFDLDMAKSDYRVVSVKPRVEIEGIERCVDKLNETRDLGPFLKGMREILATAMK